MTTTSPTISVIDLTSQLGIYALEQLGRADRAAHGTWLQLELGGVASAPRIDWYRPYAARDWVPPAAVSKAVVLVVGPGALERMDVALRGLAEAPPAAMWVYLMPSAVVEESHLRVSMPPELAHALVYRLPDSSPQTFWFVLMEQLGKLSAAQDVPPSRLSSTEKTLMSSNLSKSMSAAMTINGALAAALVDYRSGMCLAQTGGGLNLELAASGNTEVVRAKLKTMEMLGLRRGIEDILITLGDQYHLIRLIPNAQGLFLYLVLDKEKGNLALARFKLSEIERALVV